MSQFSFPVHRPLSADRHSALHCPFCARPLSEVLTASEVRLPGSEPTFRWHRHCLFCWFMPLFMSVGVCVWELRLLIFSLGCNDSRKQPKTRQGLIKPQVKFKPHSGPQSTSSRWERHVKLTSGEESAGKPGVFLSCLLKCQALAAGFQSPVYF